MTNSDDDKKQLAPRPGRRWWRILLLSGTGAGILGLVGAVAAREWVQKKLAPIVASEVSQTLKRPVEIGPLERFSPIGLRFGRSSVPTTAIDPDYASAEAVEVKFSILPLLFNRTLKLDITLVKPSAYIEQDAEGRWVNIPTQDKKPAGLFKTEIEAIRVENAGAVLVPSPAVGQKTSAPISVSLKNGSALFREQNQRVLYELNGQFTNNDNFAVKADSLLPAAQTNVLLQSQNLPLSDLARLLKLSGISLQKGLANSNLTVQVRDNKLSGITGTASFAGVQANINPLKQIVQNGSGQLRFQGTNLIVDSLTANYGLIPVQIAGTVATGANFNTEQASFNLITNVQPVAVANIISAVETELGQKVVLPIAVATEVKADAKLTGTVANPVLAGAIASTKPATVDRLQLNNISTNFKLERGRIAQTPAPNSPPSTVPLSSLALTLSDILVVPAAGGKISGKGEVDLALGSENSRSGLVFDLQAENLPGDAIAQIYALPIPAAVKIGSVSAKAQVFGPLNNIQARAQWQALQGTFPASGEIRAGGNTADLQNTVVKIGDAAVNVDAAIQDRQWEAILKGDRVALKSLQPLIPGLNLPPELAGLFSGTAEAAGTLDDLSLNGIYASGKGTLNVADSIVDVNGKLESGRWQASGKTEKVALNRLIDIGLPFLATSNYNTSPAANLDNLKSKIQNLKSLDGQLAGEFQAAGNVDNLTASAINLSTNGKLNIADSSVNLKAELTDGNWQATAQTDRTDLSRLVDLTLPLLDVASAFNPENQQPANLKSKIQNLKSIDGQLSSQFTASGSLDNLTASAINLNGSGKLNLGGSNVNFKGELAAGNWQGTAETDRTDLSSLVNLGLPLLDAASAFNPEKQEQYSNLKSKIQNLKSLDGQISNQIQAAGSLDKSADIAVNSSGKLNIADGTVDFKGKLDAGQWQAVADLDRVILSRLEQTVRNLQLFTLTATLPKGFDGRVNGQYQASGSLDNLTAKGIRASGEGRILVDRLGAIDTAAKLENGNLEALLETNGVTVSNLEQTLKQTGLLTTNLPREIAGTLDGKLRIVGNTDNLTANGITANGDGQIRLANGGGIVSATGSAQSGNWRASIEGDQIALSRFQKAFEAQRQSLQAGGLVSQAQNLPLLRGLFNGNVNLSGPIAAASAQTVRAGGSFRISELPFLKQPFDAIFNWDGKRIEVEQAATRGLTASGFVGVELAGKGLPSISNLDLDVKLSNFNLEALPAEQLAFLTPIGVKNASEKNQPVRGNVDFTGRLTGTLAALSLVGDVEVRNLAVNEVAFDSVLAGKVTASSDKSVDLRLAGVQDKIEVALNQSFLPTSFLVKRGESVARGQAEGETLRVNLSDFPLAALNLSPGKEAGLGPITGTVSGQVNVPGWKMPLNPATLQANGQIAIAQPAIGYIKGDSFQAEFSYANGSATLTNGIFRQGTGQYSISGNVKAGANPEFAGKVNIQQGNLQQVLAALQYFNLGDLARGLKPPVYGNSGDVQTVAVGEPEAPLIEQLRRLAEIEVILQQQQAVKQSEKLPVLSQLQGTFGGEIAVAGSLRTGVQAQFNVKGDNWQWGKYVAEQFSIEGSFQDGILTVLPLEIRSGKSAIGFSGQLGQKAQSGQLRVENVPVEELAKLIELPFVDVTGNLNLRANLAGSLENPQATGELSLLDGTLNGEPIKKADSSFSYSNARVNFGGSALVTQTEPIEVQGSLPFELPFASVKPDNNQIDFRANLQNEGLAVINVLTPQVAWVNGKGQVQIRVGGTLQQPVAEGIANFENATVRARAFPEPITGLTGAVRFEGDRIRVEQIRGQLSKGEVVAQGVIPLSVPFAEGDVDAANPLAVNLDKLGLNLRGLYRGGAVGQVQATGTALRPQLSGNIELYDGEVFLPSAGGGTKLVSSDSPPATSSPTTPTEVSTSPATPTATSASPSFEVGLNDLQLKLGRGVRVTSAPILNFQATGALTVNGTLDDIRPAGTIRLTSGSVNLFTTQFKLDKGYPQTATFVPTQGLDPTLDVRLATSVQEVSRFRTPGTSVASEIADEPTSFGSVRSVRIQALVKGKASGLAENLELRSSPSRSSTEIVALLGGSFVQTLGQGDSTLAIANLAGAGLFNNLQSVVTNATGLSEFRLFPTRIRGNEGQTATSSSSAASGAGSLGIGLEVGADITRNLSASIIRVLSANQPTEFNVRYRLNDKILLRGSTNFQGDNRVTAEYELRF
ncbi:MAG: translocation/assembly module TamB domain-containing protein [Microcoleus sp. PH2017_10_PVI_O_A]|uniref:translocation/assembly module TamB domain-containing protein n=1 Tax=unclassified Microcoleus TaxID=2642155 RepID=UPI001D364905|nr:MULTISPECIES: translocation/assembly module TamB [unclassified Microcoleus]TAE82895.1 MAG: translocation/assembly module TamB [Oscillatoriales cyanobacterium]MCC3406111.1 translocation/assembly module TamB domain-containing protein [Microcoleus sp. PH2017_10_PVI_O_A]MCC3462367.1 translocation/assembly module TamB domain-containing protein [Microcoleus sp. PH2017_11_PCY_U_A]MCC3479012.1 translocation/assembly module TamB domain-containing protein [Microcoleus sp. PH2017_12_PCY_D_A]MCC3529407